MEVDKSKKFNQVEVQPLEEKGGGWFSFYRRGTIVIKRHRIQRTSTVKKIVFGC